MKTLAHYAAAPTQPHTWLSYFFQSLPLTLLLSIFTLRDLNPTHYDHLLAEDGPVEYLQALLLITAMFFFLKITLSERHPTRALAFLLTIASFFLAGEEVSWGQRIFGLSTPAVVKEMNTQGELTLHNLKGEREPFRILTWAVLVSVPKNSV